MIASAPGLKLEPLLRVPLDCNWEVAYAGNPAGPEDLGSLHFAPAQVPGTVASALREQSKWHFGAGIKFDAGEYWFRVRFETSPVEQGEEIVLQLAASLPGRSLAQRSKDSVEPFHVFATHTIEVSRLIRKSNELLIVCRALVPALRAKRRQAPAARWRTRVVAEQQLRCFRTTIGTCSRVRARTRASGTVAAHHTDPPPPDRSGRLDASGGLRRTRWFTTRSPAANSA